MFVLLRGFAKKTLLKTAKAAGLKSGKGRKQDKYVFPSGLGGATAAGGGGGAVGVGGMGGGVDGGGRRGLSHTTTLFPGSTNNSTSVSRASLFPSSSSLHHSRVTMTLPQQRPIDLSAEDLQQDEETPGESRPIPS